MTIYSDDDDDRRLLHKAAGDRDLQALRRLLSQPGVLILIYQTRAGRRLSTTCALVIAGIVTRKTKKEKKASPVSNYFSRRARTCTLAITMKEQRPTRQSTTRSLPTSLARSPRWQVSRALALRSRPPGSPPRSSRTRRRTTTPISIKLIYTITPSRVYRKLGLLRHLVRHQRVVVRLFR